MPPKETLGERQAEMRARLEAIRNRGRCELHRKRLRVTVWRKNSRRFLLWCPRCRAAMQRAAWSLFKERRIVAEAKRATGGVRWGSSLDPKFWP